MYCSSIYLHIKFMKNKYNVYYDSKHLGWKLNLGHPEQKAGMLIILLRLPVSFLIWLYWATPAQEILIMAKTTENNMWLFPPMVHLFFCNNYHSTKAPHLFVITSEI